MRTALALATLTASLPHAALLVPGHSLGGVRLGEPAATVRATLGRHGVCDGCSTTTWYFTYRKFTQPGLAVELAAGRVSAVYTIWRPAGWHTAAGLRLGAVEAQVTKLEQPVTPMQCPSYTALVHDTGTVRTVYYIVDGKLWGFGLMAAGAPPCR
ncbi:MAG TPA: hypothetical protein VGH92_14010 [Gaiellaceae bacterium]|jgi:hypothetical protein